MEIIIHRINTIKKLKKIPKIFGAEIDLRVYKSKIILNHEPFKSGDTLDNFLKHYKHGTLILNIKEDGIEDKVIKKVKKAKIKSYFLLDVEMPYMYSATNVGIRDIAVRFSEYEDISLTKHFNNKLKWVWIDTATKLPINKKNIQILSKLKSVLVCPERWGRAKDIEVYKKKLKRLNFTPTAVMTGKQYVNKWMK